MAEEENKTVFDKKIKPVLMYVGTIGAILMAIAYVITVFVLIFGFKAETTLNLTVFSVVTAAVGLVIMQFLKIQGVDFAKNIPENKKLLDEYYGTTTKDKKNHSITYFWVTSVIKDVLIKGVTLAVSSIGVVYLVLEGSRDWKMLMLAGINLIMFICFGLLSLVKAYDFFNHQHVKYMKDKLKEVKKEEEEVKNEDLQGEGSTVQPEPVGVEKQNKIRTK